MNQQVSEQQFVEEKRRAQGKKGGVADSPLRVLIVAPSIDILGGQAVQAARLLEGLAEEPSLEVGFLPINPRLPGPFRQLQRIKYVRTFVTTLQYAVSLLKHVRKYDLVHIFSAAYFSFVLAPTPAMLVSKLYGKKIVLNYHSGEAEDHLTRWRRTAIPTLKLADAIAVQSDYLVSVFARFNVEARAISNHLETERFRFRERKPLRPIFLANRNLEPHYNVGCVLRAFAKIQGRMPEAQLIVVGDGSQRAELELLARSLDLRQTEFRGRIPPEEMRDVYDEADIYLNASNIDSMPISILEAFASGLAVVTTCAGGIPFIVTHERTGLMVERDDDEALALAALRLLEDEALASSLTGNAFSECEKYSWPAVRDAWLGLYREVMRGKAQAKQNEAEKVEQKVTSGEQRAVKVEQEMGRIKEIDSFSH
jgi:glycosyltransferase involved in cell wall biosynthesis